MRLSNFC